MILKDLAIWKLKRAGYEDMPLDLYWSAATELARKDIRKIRLLQKTPGDAWILYGSKPHRVHTINHNDLHSMSSHAVMAYIRNLAEAIIGAAHER